MTCEAFGTQSGRCAKRPAIGENRVEWSARPDGACGVRNRPADSRDAKKLRARPKRMGKRGGINIMKKKLLSLRSSRGRSFPWAAAGQVCARCSVRHRPERRSSPLRPYLP